MNASARIETEAQAGCSVPASLFPPRWVREAPNANIKREVNTTRFLLTHSLENFSNPSCRLGLPAQPADPLRNVSR
jgi:hypothetical protein